MDNKLVECFSEQSLMQDNIAFIQLMSVMLGTASLKLLAGVIFSHNIHTKVVQFVKAQNRPAPLEE